MSFLKDYEPVEDRLRAFWEDHPEGRVTTELVHVGEDGYIVKASVWRGPHLVSMGPGWRSLQGQEPDSTGYAQEAVTERGVNATSALENCETSAIGRALANLGYAAKGKRPSREEMTKVSDVGYGEGPASDQPREVDTTSHPGKVSGRTGTKAEGSPESTPDPSAAGADTAPEGGVPSPDRITPPPSGVTTCRHRKGEDDRCVNCGRPWVEIVEGTVEDLGGAA